MPVSKEASGNLQIVGIVLLIGFCVAGIWWVLTPVAIDDERSPRVVRLQQLIAQIKPSETQEIVLAPWLNADVFTVGTAFPLDGSLAMATSTACDQVQIQESQMGLTLSDNSSFGFSPELELVSKGKINAKATRSVEYSVVLNEAKIAPGEVELLRDLYADPDCLAAIANREVLVLFGVYRGSETFGIKRAAKSGLDLDFAISNFKDKLGISGDYAAEDLFSRQNVAMYWAMIRMRLNAPEFGGSDVPEAARLAIAQDVLTGESDYAQRAIPNTELAAPSEAEINQVLDTILSHYSN